MDPDQHCFQSIPWCIKFRRNSTTSSLLASSQQYKDSTEDALFAETLKNDEIVRAFLSFYRRPALGVARIEEVHTLLSLGCRLNGYPHLCHGGIVATIMDEVMGTLLVMNKSLRNADIKGAPVTTYLSVTYLKPVATPQTILVSARFREVRRQKYYIEATVNDRCGAVLARAESP